MPQLRIVILDCPYDTIEDVRTQKLFARTTAFKIQGYKEHHAYGVLPCDSYDFIGTHILLCEEEQNGELFPIMGFKSITLERCRTFKLPFPMFNLIPENQPQHIKAIEKILFNTEAKAGDIAYNGSWTIHPRVKDRLDLLELAKVFPVAAFVKYYSEYCQLPVLAAATLRFKIEKMKEFVGFDYLSSGADKLPPVPCAFMKGDLVAIMHLSKLTQEGIDFAKKIDKLWKNKLVIRTEQEKALPVAA